MNNVEILKYSFITESLTKNISKLVDVHSVTNAVVGSISSISVWNITNQLGMLFVKQKEIAFI